MFFEEKTIKKIVLQKKIKKEDSPEWVDGCKSRFKHCLCVVYFDQRLGAAHSKRWSKSSFSAFLLQKTSKKQEFCSKIQ